MVDITNCTTVTLEPKSEDPLPVWLYRSPRAYVADRVGPYVYVQDSGGGRVGAVRGGRGVERQRGEGHGAGVLVLRPQGRHLRGRGRAGPRRHGARCGLLRHAPQAAARRRRRRTGGRGRVLEAAAAALRDRDGPPAVPAASSMAFAGLAR